MESQVQTIQSDDSPLTAKDLVLRTKLSDTFGRKTKGIFLGEALQLVLKKIGVSEDELKAISLRSIKHNKEMYRKFRQHIEETKIDPQEIIKELKTTLQPQGYPTLDDDFMTLRLYIENPGRWIKLHREGSGSNFLNGDTRVWETKIVDYHATFIPPVTGPYGFSIPFFATGPYILISDDVPCHDRFAKLEASVSANVLQVNTYPGVSVSAGTSATVFNQREENASLSDYVLFANTLLFGTSLLKDELVKISVVFKMTVDVSGEGSIGEFDFSFGKGMLYCPEVNISFRAPKP